jgi:hypothetical protein
MIPIGKCSKCGTNTITFRCQRDSNYYCTACGDHHFHGCKVIKMSAQLDVNGTFVSLYRTSCYFCTDAKENTCVYCETCKKYCCTAYHLTHGDHNLTANGFHKATETVTTYYTFCSWCLQSGCTITFKCATCQGYGCRRHAEHTIHRSMVRYTEDTPDSEAITTLNIEAIVDMFGGSHASDT